MFPNWSGWKTIKLVLASLIAFVPTVVPAPYQVTAMQVGAVITAIVVLLSGTPMGPAMAAKIAAVAMLAIGTVGSVACLKAVPAVGPVASCVTSVVADALQGMSIAQIVAAAGPGCVTDAEDVIAILLGSGDPRVRATVAYREARLARGLP